MPSPLSRRRFLQVASATGLALAVGPSRWGWARPASPFADLQDDPFLRLPEGFTYKVIAETGQPLLRGDKPYPRPQFPDLNVVFSQPDGRLLLSTSHEVPSFFPLPIPPSADDYDPFAGGAVTSLLLNPDLSIAEGRYNAGGMLTNCSGSGTPWGTVLTGEEETTTLAADHGFIWEVDPDKSTKTRLDACGRFDHETAVVDPSTGFVYLTEDAGTALLYRLRPDVAGDLVKGGVLEAYVAGPGAGPGSWVTIDDPLAESSAPSAQGKAKGALVFKRLEGGRFDGRDFYFAETEDDASCGKIWRLDTRTDRLELWAQGKDGGAMCMPDNLTFDAAGNIFVTEDKSNASSDNPNRVLFVDRKSGEIATFAEVVLQAPEVTDEPTGPAFSPDGKVLFLNLQRTPDFGMTLAITGPFAEYRSDKGKRAALPRGAEADEHVLLRGALVSDLPVGIAAGAIALRRRGRVDKLEDDLEAIASELGSPTDVPAPRRRIPKLQ